MTETPQLPTRSVERALRLLTAVAESASGIGLVDAARAVGLAPSTATRILRTLETTRFVERSADGSYAAGPELRRLAARHAGDDPVQRRAQPILDALAERTGESCYLAVPLDASTATYVRMAPSPRAVRHVSWLGRTVPRRGTAVGAALAGQVGPNGCAVVEGGLEADTTAVAAPVVQGGGIVAVVNVVGPTFRVDAERLAAAATDAAAALARSL